MEAIPTSPLPSHLPGSPDIISNTSSSPPPLLPSYLISELPSGDLPPPPPIALCQDMASRYYMCCYDPPSPDVKSEYDPQLPPDFFPAPDLFPSSPPLPPLPQPPIPASTPVLTPTTQWSSVDSSHLDNLATFRSEMDFHGLVRKPEGYNKEAFETSSTISSSSSSVMTATYCQTPDSVTSALSPHALRMSPVSTDAVTLSTQVSNGSPTPSEISFIPSICSVNQEYNMETSASSFIPQASVITDAASDVPVSSGLPVFLLTTSLALKHCKSSTQTIDTHSRKEFFQSESGSSVPSVISYTTNDTAGPAVMSSPLSTDVPSLSSLPTDPDSTSSGFGSLTADTWSLSTEMDSQTGNESVAKTKIYSSPPSEVPNITSESGMASPAFTSSCTITPMPTDSLTPHSCSPTLTPLGSPIPSSPLPHFEAVQLSHKPQCTVIKEISSMVSLQQDNGSVMTASLEPLQIANERMISSPSEHSQTTEEANSAPQESLQVADGVTSAPPELLQATNGVTSASPRLLQAAYKMTSEPMLVADGVTSVPLEPMQVAYRLTPAPLEQFQAYGTASAYPSHTIEREPGPYDYSSNNSCFPVLDVDVSNFSSSHVSEEGTTHKKVHDIYVSLSKCMKITDETSGNVEVLVDRMPSNQDNSNIPERTDDGAEIETNAMPPIPVSVSNGRSFEQMTDKHGNIVKEKGEEHEASILVESRERDSLYSVYENESGENIRGDHEERVINSDECKENVYGQLLKDVNGNISNLGLKNESEALPEDREVGNRSEVLQQPGTQTMMCSSFDIHSGEGMLGTQEEGQEEVFTEDLRPLLSSASSLTCPHINGCVISSLSHIPPNKTKHNLSLQTEPLLSSCNERDNLSQCRGTSSTLVQSRLLAPKPRPQRITQVSPTSKDAIELLDDVVVTMENLSADLPVSLTMRKTEVLSSDSKSVTEIRMADQPQASNLEARGKLPIGEHQSQDTIIKEPEVAAHDSCLHFTTLLSHPSVTEALLLHEDVSASHSNPSQWTSFPNLSPTNNVIHPGHSLSMSFWNIPHTDTKSLQSSYNLDEHANTSARMKDATEFPSEKGVHFHPCSTDFLDCLSAVCEMSSSSLHSSSQTSSLLDGQPSSSQAPCSRTPPTPPPRSCHNTPRTSLAPPLPPPRQYMLVPINQTLGALRQTSPPPAPPRSTSVHRASPPPPPHSSGSDLPSLVEEWNERPPVPPLPVLSSHNTPLQPTLTPVPEESSTPQSPLLSRSPHLSPPIGDRTHPTVIPPTDTMATQKMSPVSPPSPTCSNDPPALPPPPEDEQEEEQLPLPPPPLLTVESEDETVPVPLPLPLPSPPPPDVLLNPLSPLSTLQGKVETSAPLNIIQIPFLPDLCATNSQTNLSSSPSSDPDPPPPAVDDIAIQSSTKHINSTASKKSPMPNSQAVDASAAPPSPPIPGVPHAPPSSLPEPPCAPPNTKEATKPSLITTSPYGKMVVVRSDLPLSSPEEEVRVAFTAAKDWGYLTEGEDTLSVYTQLRPVIQQGPQCGLVALSMASQVFPQTVEVEELLATGQAQGITRHGEMFSATKLAWLAEKTVPGLQAEVRRDVLSSPATLLHLLLQGDLVLVPYDAERNHQPGQKGGHKAHWGVICGCLVQSHALTFPTTTAKLDSHVDNLWHLRPRSRTGRSRSVTPCTPTLPTSSRIGQRSLSTPDRASGGEGTQFSVSWSRVNTPMLADLKNDYGLKLVPLWRQGKSRKIVASLLDQLCESNDQLISYPQPTTPHEEEYVVDSVQDGLAGQVVVLHKTKVALSDLVGLLQEK